MEKVLLPLDSQQGFFACSVLSKESVVGEKENGGERKETEGKPPSPERTIAGTVRKNGCYRAMQPAAPYGFLCIPTIPLYSFVRVMLRLGVL